jgi:predicted O-methyltransferase YrrM
VNPDKVIRELFRIKRGDSLPYTGWNNKVTRDDLAPLFATLGYKRGAEIGVAQGTYSKILCSAIPGLELFCVDAYTAYERTSQRICDERYAKAKQSLLGHNVHFVVKPSLEASYDFEDGSLDFVYIDGDHTFDGAMTDLIQWSKKVRSGGIVSGHDYYSFYKAGVIPAVDVYTRAHQINAWYVTKELTPSFLWVKQ